MDIQITISINTDEAEALTLIDRLTSDEQGIHDALHYTALRERGVQPETLSGLRNKELIDARLIDLPFTPMSFGGDNWWKYKVSPTRIGRMVIENMGIKAGE